MFDDPERYEHDGFYEEDNDYEDEYETDYSDYIVDDEENENVLWDDEEEAADDLPEKKRRKRKNQVILADNDTDTEEIELSEQAMWQIAKEEQLIEELEADAEEHPFEDGTDEEGGRTKLFLLTMIRIPKKSNYPNKPCGRSQKKNSSSKNWKPTPRNIPLRMVLTRKNQSVRNSNENCGQKPLHDWRIPPEHSGSLKM